MIVVQFPVPSGDSPSLDQIFSGFANVEKFESLFTKTPAFKGNVADEGFYGDSGGGRGSGGARVGMRGGGLKGNRGGGRGAGAGGRGGFTGDRGGGS